MIKLIPSDDKDVERLLRWIALDEFHRDLPLNPYFWLTAAHGSLLAFRLDDNDGPLCYVRLDEKDSLGEIRLHTQFAPRDEVSKLRLVKGMLQCIPMVLYECRRQHAAGIIFESVSPTLIGFMSKKFGFKPAGGTDYILPLQEGV
jgi:hypothetical protein